MTKFKKKAGIFSLAAVLIFAAAIFGYSQTQFVELYDVIFRVQDPQMRFHGTMVIENLANEEVLQLVGREAAVNEIQIESATTGSGPRISAIGGDTNIDLELAAKGTGKIAAPHPMTGMRREVITSSATATRTLTRNECGAVAIATGGQVTYVLPAVGETGCMFTFVAGHVDGEILVNAAAANTCVITTFSAVGADADTQIVTDTTCNTGLKNTAATNAVGDSLTLVSDGTQWLGVGISGGIWSTQ